LKSKCSGQAGEKLIALFDVLHEAWVNRNRMLRVVRYDIKIENRSFYLGTFWKVLSPLIQIGTFWLIFGLGIRGGSPIDGFPFLVWLLAGMVPWFFINRGITTGSTSINTKSGIIFKIKYPIPTVPIGAILHNLYDHVILLIILTLVLAAHGYYPNLYWLNLIYYISFTFIFLVALAMITSVIVRLAPDFGRLIASLLQMLFFLTPILWQETHLPPWVLRVFSANPIRYIVNGFRNSLLYQRNFFEFPWRIAFFWPVIIGIFAFGCWLQRKFAHRFADWM